MEIPNALRHIVYKKRTERIRTEQEPILDQAHEEVRQLVLARALQKHVLALQPLEGQAPLDQVRLDLEELTKK